MGTPCGVPRRITAMQACVMQENKSSSPDFQCVRLSPTAKQPKLDGYAPNRKQSPVRFLSDPYDYPRKRASIACEVCRVRKVRCDAGKPGCGSCTKLGVACSYAIARNYRPEQDAAGLFLNRLDARLDRLETKLDQSLNSNPAASSFKHVTFLAPASTQHPYTTPLPPPSGPSPTCLLGYDRIGLSLEAFARLQEHEMHPLLKPLLFDESEVFLEREIAQGKRLYQAGDPGTLDLSPRLCGRLQQAFARNVLAWFPIFDQESFSKLVAKSCTHLFDQSDPEVCLILLILSLGALSKAEDLTSDDPHEFPGLNYFLAACRTLNKDGTLDYSLLEAQCHVLISLYLLLCLRPLQASHAISLASKSVLTLLNFQSRLNADAQLREGCRRAYWACFIIEHELRNYIVYKTAPLLQVHEIVPLPSGYYNDPSMLWFLAEISMRRLYTYALENIWKAPHVVYEPKVIEVLREQISIWYDSLPPNIKFPKDTTMILDPQKAFLRAQYFALRWVIGWPAVVRIVTKGADDEQQHADLLTFSSEVIHYSIAHIHSSESLLQGRHPLLFANLVGMWCATMLLVTVHRAPALEPVHNPGAPAAILKSHAMLSTWAANPGVASIVHLLEEQMARNGLRTTQDLAIASSARTAAVTVQTADAPQQGGMSGISGTKGLGVGVAVEHESVSTRIGMEMNMGRFLDHDLVGFPRTWEERYSNS
ncbi:hypothetical protein K469DRAFT_750148 [Zopfia rhizophila CBS 207.26]|uniref:Zn(2)-C6 fungal-type domain-containing protein n=1 Tax=Zopfia rhizophila CBS 207.26 TaxID=1314779 RepID=A0A6A6E232_9PEZI|nr:hypothetical protein K469DRAFT_750148 [Zopfia rhizophila CBS 207.26]